MLLVFSGCSDSRVASTSIFSTEEVYQPPALGSHLPEESPTALPTPSSPAKKLTATLNITPTRICSDNLSFLEDLSYPDGSTVEPRELFEKQWLVENSGSCNWDGGYRIRLVTGSKMGMVEEQALYPARVGYQAVISMIFSAPNEPGAYKSVWQAYNALGQAFGDLIYIDFIVIENGE